MPLKIELKGNKTIVETDYKGGDICHSAIQEDGELKGAMRRYNITKLEIDRDVTYGVGFDVRVAFDKEYRKKYGSNYFYPG
ncbi:MAG: hypothetical protein QXZ20_03320 [Candidatus Aenigmatarchaeota archaeon]